jgi:signal peptide peptidase SppA
MRGDYLLAELRMYPWAIADIYLQTVARILTRLELGQPMSLEDEEVIASSKEARARPAGARAGDVAIVGIYGVMMQRGGMVDLCTMAASTSGIASQIQQLAADSSVGSIVLDIDSPGGSVYGIQELADAIFEARSAKPVVAVANSVAASAAYYAASQATELYAAPGAEVGSIGVYTMHADYTGALEQAGVKVDIIKAGKFKAEGNPYEPLSEDARAAVQASVDSYYGDFIRSVARGRNVSLKAVREGMGQGRMLQAGDAKAENMIDGVATLGQVVAKMQARSKRAGPSARARAERELQMLG